MGSRMSPVVSPGGTTAPDACAGGIPLGGVLVFGLLGAIGWELVGLQCVWELGATMGAHPHPAHPRVLAGMGE